MVQPAADARVSDRVVAAVLLLGAAALAARTSLTPPPATLGEALVRRWRGCACAAGAGAALAATFLPSYRGARRDAVALAVRALLVPACQLASAFAPVTFHDALPPPPSLVGWYGFSRTRVVMPTVILTVNAASRLPPRSMLALTALQAVTVVGTQPLACRGVARTCPGVQPYFEAIAAASARAVTRGADLFMGWPARPRAPAACAARACANLMVWLSAASIVASLFAAGAVGRRAGRTTAALGAVVGWGVLAGVDIVLPCAGERV